MNTPPPAPSSMPPIDLLAFDRAGCEYLVEAWGYKPFHGRNLFKWLHKHGVVDCAAMTDLPAALRARLIETAHVQLPTCILEQPSVDGTIKWVLELTDGQRIEMVLIPEEQRRTLCISSQVGCALACQFCATARQGFNRNLTVSELIGQVWLATRFLGRAPTNIVLMGMGEPLANFDAVMTALSMMQDDFAYMLAKQRVTISTAGLVPAIHRLCELTDVSLAVSLHAPTNELRDQLMPINRKYPLEQLIPACRAYIGDDRRRRITWEYVMLDGVNDSDRHAKALMRLLEGVRSKVNLIPFNPFPDAGFQPSSLERIDAFRMRLIRSGLVTVTRKTRGDEIAAACGQLVGRVVKRGAMQPTVI
ncbi:23S rRNA (adenine(2503)-C(2))-methyltransferase RlmN [Thiospirillum jenense]|uniref:Dual-specificity RNA methyltransferase RlmN n=1 Tax=Thiospirillum jenense TaxID=1653858 RepID=A0A839HCB0_9GAMM|nr:23S rRNA (adenine(2503)-C(2))-methyltransferase RlmN [Thiospirillum jenense]MBB1126174.1 23S rRNA (adenine(2503)-C(2))-methyltransferase RlmN [Thiospirillum jenense]